MPCSTANVFYCRIGTCLGLTCLTITFLIIADIDIAVNSPKLLQDSDRGCSMKAAFSLYIMATISQVAMAVTDIVLLVCSTRTEASLKYDCKYMKVIVHFCSGAGIIIATIIFGLKHTKEVDWAFWLTVVASLLALINSILWLQTQHDKSSLKKAGVNVKNLEDGKMEDGTDRET